MRRSISKTWTIDMNFLIIWHTGLGWGRMKAREPSWAGYPTIVANNDVKRSIGTHTLCISPFAAQPAFFSNCVSLLCNCSVLQQIRQTVSECTSILILLCQLSVIYLITEHLGKHHKGFKDSVTHSWVMWKKIWKNSLAKPKNEKQPT